MQTVRRLRGRQAWRGLCRGIFGCGFIRRWRKAFDGGAAKVGGVAILAVMAGLRGILWISFQIAFTAKTGVPTR